MGFIRFTKAIISRSCPSLVLLAILFFTPGLFAQERIRTQGEPRFDRVVIESLDGDAWNGVVFMAKAYQQQISFALRVGSRRGRLLDGEKIFSAVSEVGPHAPDASYCRVSWRYPAHQAPVTLEWSRIDATTVVGFQLPAGEHAVELAR